MKQIKFQACSCPSGIFEIASQVPLSGETKGYDLSLFLSVTSMNQFNQFLHNEFGDSVLLKPFYAEVFIVNVTDVELILWHLRIERQIDANKSFTYLVR